MALNLSRIEDGVSGRRKSEPILSVGEPEEISGGVKAFDCKSNKLLLNYL
jgi:hypothetical protein